jgi:uncharacterized protein (DUF305 family)
MALLILASMRSMIPHRSSAIQMYRHAEISTPAIVRLWSQIVSPQRDDIAQMKPTRVRY